MRQAEWNNITWGNSGKHMAHIKSFKISRKLKTEEKEDEKGNNKTVVKGHDSENLTISYSAGFGIGLDPRGEFEMLKKCAGMQDKFILGGQQLGRFNFTLDDIELSNTILADNGRILSGDVTLNLSTDSNASSKGGKGTKTKAKSSKKAKSGSLTLTPEDYAKAKALSKEKK